jgi:hypothetical protein
MAKKGRRRRNAYILIHDFLHLAYAGDRKDQKHEEEHEEECRQELRDRKRRPGDARESEKTGQNTDNQKNQRELKHRFGPRLYACARTVPDACNMLFCKLS